MSGAKNTGRESKKFRKPTGVWSKEFGVVM